MTLKHNFYKQFYFSEMEPTNFLVLGILAVGCLLRASISLHSYSGESKPPMYGDFEAQRHWQEITINLPVKDWYENTTNNDLEYWGLDYPPLTAYHSYLCGRIAKYMNETFVSLKTSRGITDGSHKNFMRNTVLFMDFLIYIPAIYLCCLAVYEKLLKNQNFNKNIKFLHLVVMLYYPGQILIDNGHFQYNNVSILDPGQFQNLILFFVVVGFIGSCSIGNCINFL